jgi:hypothetical protein
MSALIGMFASSLTQVTSDANMMKSTDRMRHSLEPVYKEQCQDDFLRIDVSAKIDSNYCALVFIGGQVSAKQVNKIGGRPLWGFRVPGSGSL